VARGSGAIQWARKSCVNQLWVSMGTAIRKPFIGCTPSEPRAHRGDLIHGENDMRSEQRRAETVPIDRYNQFDRISLTDGYTAKTR
jgi:hypothetical protein